MASDALVLAVNVGLLALIVGVGFAIERSTDIDARRRALPGWQQLLVAGVAMGTMLSLFDRPVPVPAVDEVVVGFGAFAVLWFGLHYLVAELTGVEPAAGSGC